ncbi:VOC family protein [Gordonia jinghuaiqii]|uniref:VOC family protein n=1 Tax=Gordonia jinghuaiqii TaxID=2758710 RepID=A0A7D7LXN9_9ACTN|nr:VOC family protein [Gordonia jinghuaiqii]MCR5977669.1 VOC family protein [Gordonia jinghuaiqii]QMT02338.1 VOC family protein [Gordonia jinghuaiqii]
MAEYAAPSGAPIWFDLMSSDTAKAEDFYGQIFGWEAETPNEEFGGYRNFYKNGKRVAGLSPTMEGAGPPNIWSVYLHAEDAEATAKAVEAAGGSIMVPPMAIGDEGTMMVAVDTAGAVIGFWQPGTHQGYAEYGDHGTPYWFECQSKDYAKSLDFYRTVLGARIEEVGTGGDPDAVGPDNYGQIFYGDLSYAGIMDAAKMFPPEVPSFWQLYITVDDVAASVKQAETLGAEILMPGEDTPWGTLAAIKDPLGALICLGHPPAGM